ncbi:MAG: thiamine phosphate synthase [Micrococcus sp.]|nr:thiamine phosphate synthase [Micrococcus sp.]
MISPAPTPSARTPSTLSPAPLSRADRLARLATARLYLCTDLQRFLRDDRLDERAFAEFCAACFRGGVDIIQVRDKHVDVPVELRALAMLVELAREHGALSAANDRADVAQLTGVDMFHTGQTDLSTAQCRTLLGEDVVLGRSCHTVAQVNAARTEPGLDYYCTGPVWETPTKPGRAAVGLDLPAHAARAADHDDARPFFAIGGIDADRLSAVLETGARRIVVVRAITQAADPEAAARTLRDALDSAPVHRP